jgi:hypothetical protein
LQINETGFNGQSSCWENWEGWASHYLCQKLQ